MTQPASAHVAQCTSLAMLARRSPDDKALTWLCACRGVQLQVQTQGVEVVLIDFTLSRLTSCQGTSHSCDLEADPAIFAGRKGDCQAGPSALQLCLHQHLQ